MQLETFLFGVRTEEDGEHLRSILARETAPAAALEIFSKQAPILSDEEEEAPDADETKPTPAPAAAEPTGAEEFAASFADSGIGEDGADLFDDAGTSLANEAEADFGADDVADASKGEVRWTWQAHTVAPSTYSGPITSL